MILERVTLYLSLVLIAGCSVPAQQAVYDQNSWKTIIPASCQSFFDGCNNCRRSSDGVIAACTRKYCQTYSRPVCLDEK